VSAPRPMRLFSVARLSFFNLHEYYKETSQTITRTDKPQNDIRISKATHFLKNVIVEIGYFAIELWKTGNTIF
jgi:hypothetical protein